MNSWLPFIGICISLLVCSSHQDTLRPLKATLTEVPVKETLQNGKAHYQLLEKVDNAPQAQQPQQTGDNVYSQHLPDFGSFKSSPDEQSQPSTTSDKQGYVEDELEEDMSEEDTLPAESESGPPATESKSVADSSATDKAREMDKLIYELVEDEHKEAVRNAFENAALKAVALKAKLDMKIDEALMTLNSLRNLRRQIESAYSFANRFVGSKVANEQIKRYVVAQLDSAIQQVEQTLQFQSGHQEKTAKQASGQ